MRSLGVPRHDETETDHLLRWEFWNENSRINSPCSFFCRFSSHVWLPVRESQSVAQFWPIPRSVFLQKCKKKISFSGATPMVVRNNWISTVFDSLTKPRLQPRLLSGSPSSGGPTMGRQWISVGLIAWTRDMGEHVDQGWREKNEINSIDSP